MMCEFCSFNGAPLFDKGDLTVYIVDTEKWLYIDKTTEKDVQIEINFCPKCGKELGNV